MTTLIRKCELADLPAVGAMFMNWHHGRQAESDLEQLKDRLSDFFLVCEYDETIIGFVIGARGPVDAIGIEISREAFPETLAYLEIQDLYVATEHRNQGIGSQLMSAIMQRGRDAGLKHSMVYSSNADYSRIGRFYEKFGFRIDHLFMKQ